MGHNTTTLRRVLDINLFPFFYSISHVTCQLSQACVSTLPQISNFYCAHNIPYVHSFPTDNLEDVGTNGKRVLKKGLKVWWWKSVEVIPVAHNRK